LGNGVAATIAVQDPSPFIKPIVEVSSTTGGQSLTEFFDLSTGGPLPSTARNAGTLVPDIVGAVRGDQAWGGAQLAAIAHDNRATYYAAEAPVGLATIGHPADKWGWAVSGGLELNLPWWGKGDSFAIQSQYCRGASYACYNNSGTRFNDVA